MQSISSFTIQLRYHGKNHKNNITLHTYERFGINCSTCDSANNYRECLLGGLGWTEIHNKKWGENEKRTWRLTRKKNKWIHDNSPMIDKRKRPLISSSGMDIEESRVMQYVRAGSILDLMERRALQTIRRRPLYPQVVRHQTRSSPLSLARLQTRCPRLLHPQPLCWHIWQHILVWSC